MAQLELRRSNRALRDSERRLRASEERLQLALNAGHIGTWVWDIWANHVVADVNFAQMVSVNPDRAARGASGERFLEAIHPEDRPRIEVILAKVLKRGGAYAAEHRLVRKDGSVRWVAARGRCEHDGEGRPVRFAGVTVDITDLKQAQEGQELLARELSHRIKNIFAVVGGLVSLSARSHPEAKGFAEDFRQRVNALARAHEYVRPHGPDEGPGGTGETVLGLMRMLLAPYRQGGRERFVIKGEDVPIGPKSATALALIVHEQATNAVKYGALSNETGWVDLTWRLAGDRLSLSWREQGGPPAELPRRTGFGSRLIERLIRAEHRAALSRRYERTGAEVDIEVPATMAA